MYTVLVIDDSFSMRKILKDIVNSIDEFVVVATAIDAYDAREKIKDYEPDLVTIDINMPKMDGVKFLRNLMRLHPMPAVVVSGESVRGHDIFDDGAVGFIPKAYDDESLSSFAKRVEESLLSLEFLLKRYTLKKPKPKKIDRSKVNVERRNHPDKVITLSLPPRRAPNIISIGSSTGGVDALLTVFGKLRNNLPPIVITQHIPYGFSRSFAQRLHDNSNLVVHEAMDGEELVYGTAYLAPGNMHLTVMRKGFKYYAKLLDSCKVSFHKPSVDVLFRSVYNAAGTSALAIILTGMGDDGSIGMKDLHDIGVHTIAQDKKSCVVFGMPAKAIEKGAVDEIVSLKDIAEKINEYFNK